MPVLFATSLCLNAIAEDAAPPAQDAQAPAAQAAPAAAPDAAATPAPAASAAPASTDAAATTAAPAAGAAPAAAATAPAADDKKKEDAAKAEEPAYDFEHEDTFIDVPDALRSKQFVHRAILSTIIRDTARVQMGSKYISQNMGFNAIYQPANRGGKSFAKYASGVLGVTLGYSLKSGHAFEAGLDLSSTTQMLVGYKYYFQSEENSFWPFLGGGLSLELGGLHLSDPPVEAKAYQGSTSGEYLSVGAIIPLVDIALRAEAKFVFDGLDRLILDTGVGVTFFF